MRAGTTYAAKTRGTFAQRLALAIFQITYKTRAGTTYSDIFRSSISTRSLEVESEGEMSDCGRNCKTGQAQHTIVVEQVVAISSAQAAQSVTASPA
jgi:hypothetical protein